VSLVRKCTTQKSCEIRADLLSVSNMRRAEMTFQPYLPVRKSSSAPHAIFIVDYRVLRSLVDIPLFSSELALRYPD